MKTILIIILTIFSANKAYGLNNIDTTTIYDNVQIQDSVIPASENIEANGKKKIVGKKNAGGCMKTYIDGETKGECFGFEVHSGKNKNLLLNKVGFFYSEGENQMTNMKFRINVYDMSTVKKSPSSEFVSVLHEPIEFSFTLKGNKSGRFEFTLPTPIVLPKDAMVEIEMLENLNQELFWFKSNLIGKKNWAKSAIEGQWETNPFATPFFIECIEARSGF